MMTRTVSVLLALVACRASSAAREDEARKWTATLATLVEVHQLDHACEVERTVYTRTSSAYTQALTSRTRGAVDVVESDLGKAQAVLATCIKGQSDYIPSGDDDRYFRAGLPNAATSSARGKRLHDVREAWLDACFLCATPQTCVARYREVMGLQSDEVTAYSRPPACGGR